MKSGWPSASYAQTMRMTFSPGYKPDNRPWCYEYGEPKFLGRAKPARKFGVPLVGSRQYSTGPGGCGGLQDIRFPTTFLQTHFGRSRRRIPNGVDGIQRR